MQQTRHWEQIQAICHELPNTHQLGGEERMIEDLQVQALVHAPYILPLTPNPCDYILHGAMNLFEKINRAHDLNTYMHG